MSITVSNWQSRLFCQSRISVSASELESSRLRVELYARDLRGETRPESIFGNRMKILRGAGNEVANAIVEIKIPNSNIALEINARVLGPPPASRGCLSPDCLPCARAVVPGFNQLRDLLALPFSEPVQIILMTSARTGGEGERISRGRKTADDAKC